MRSGPFSLFQAAAALLLFSAVGAQEHEGLRGGASAVASHGGTAGDPPSPIEAALSPEGFFDPLGTDALPKKEVDGIGHDQPSINPEHASEGPRVAGDRGPPCRGEPETPEWVQPVMEEERMPLTAKSMGRFLPAPPVSFQPGLLRSGSNTGRTERLYGDGAAQEAPTVQAALREMTEGGGQKRDGDRGLKDERDGDTSSAPETEGPGLFAEERLEVPSLVELVVEVERLERGTIVFYAFRWGKPGG